MIWIYNTENECYIEIINWCIAGLIFSMSLMLRCLIISCLIYMEQIEEWFFRTCKFWKTILRNSLKISIHASATVFN